MIEHTSSTLRKDGPLDMPQPTGEEQSQSELLCDHIHQKIEQAGGRLSFDRFMELCLYAPGLGYYVAGARKFGAEGDFVTAPEISPLFSRCLARQCVQVLQEIGTGELLEFGAGTGTMAADILAELERLDCLPQAYLILELSPDLKSRQQETLQQKVPHLAGLVQWLDELPGSGFKGVVLANEVLDAMPVQRFRIESGEVLEQFVRWQDERFVSFWGSPTTAGLVEAVQDIALEQAEGFESELNLRAYPWVGSLGEIVDTGAVILIDYGYPQAEYYHPQRSEGTLMCHYRHRAHPDPLLLPGLQDITAHVDFTAVADAGLKAGFEIGGFTTQTFFLMGCGLDSMLAQSDPGDVDTHMQLVQQVKRLTMPTEMGERFKVLALARGVEQPLVGFGVKDQRERL
jgi:SAM-dependent MidA family methyltransferase